MSSTELKTAGQLSVEELKRELIKRNISSVGPKVILLKRLKKSISDEGCDADTMMFDPCATVVELKPEPKVVSKKVDQSLSDENKNDKESNDSVNGSHAKKPAKRTPTRGKKMTTRGKKCSNKEVEEENETNAKDISDGGKQGFEGTDLSCEAVNTSDIKEEEEPQSTEKEANLLSAQKDAENQENNEQGIFDSFDLQESLEEDNDYVDYGIEDYDDMMSNKNEDNLDLEITDHGSIADTDVKKPEDASKSSVNTNRTLTDKDDITDIAVDDTELDYSDVLSKDSSDVTERTEKKKQPKKESTETVKEKKESSKEKASDKDKKNDKSISLWVSGLSSITKASHLKAAFSKHAKVCSVKIVTNAKVPGAKCFGVVTVGSEEEAQTCIKALNVTELLNRFITVKKIPPKKTADESKKKTSEKTNIKKVVKKKIDAPSKSSSKEDPEEIKKREERERHEREEREKRWRERQNEYSRAIAIRRQKEKEVIRQQYMRERMMREEAERRTREEGMRQRMIEMKQREEAMRLEREREKIRMERERIERERAELLRMERERMEREEIKRQQMKKEEMYYRQMEESKRMKRSMPPNDEFDNRKRMAIGDRPPYDGPPPPRQEFRPATPPPPNMYNKPSSSKKFKPKLRHREHIESPTLRERSPSPPVKRRVIRVSKSHSRSRSISPRRRRKRVSNSRSRSRSISQSRSCSSSKSVASSGSSQSSRSSDSRASSRDSLRRKKAKEKSSTAYQNPETQKRLLHEAYERVKKIEIKKLEKMKKKIKKKLRESEDLAKKRKISPRRKEAIYFDNDRCLPDDYESDRRSYSKSPKRKPRRRSYTPEKIKMRWIFW